MATKTLGQIQQEVGDWSVKNFGLQTSKANGIALGSLAPLLGIVEEIGELYDAVMDADKEDALADTGVYLCDFACREGAHLFYSSDEQIEKLRSDALISLLGKLSHVVLKHHQGIRGYDVESKYITERDHILGKIMAVLCRMCKAYLNKPYLEVLTKVWKDVSSRDWKKHSKEGMDEVDCLALTFASIPKK